MALGSTLQRAAEYVRMSTEHQQYSLANQRAAITAFADAHGIEIVATYEDAGKSGLTLAGRPSLRKLISDVVAGQNVFQMILVYDVSRWGRFQDADESAHLEYLCRLSGVRVEYCAEPFRNDGTPFSSICKVVKRALAAEYSRELSQKVYVGKRRLITLGFRQGGSAGLGLRRCLVDAQGSQKGLLAHGEYKSIATDRVILVPGPSEEVAIVQRIYRDFTRLNLGVSKIAAALNREGIKSENGRPWSRTAVKSILTAEKYVGDNVWGHRSFKLKVHRHRNPPATWARFDRAFEGIISRRLFEEAQKKQKRPKRLTNDEAVERLRVILAKHGQINTQLIKADGFLDVKNVQYRFGGLLAAYSRVGYQPSRDFAFLSKRGEARSVRAETGSTLEGGVIARGGKIQRAYRDSRFVINGEFTVSVTVAQHRLTRIQTTRWRVKTGGRGCDLAIVALMGASGKSPCAYYILPVSEFTTDLVIRPQNTAEVEAFRFESLEQLFEICGRCEAVSNTLPSPSPPHDSPHMTRSGIRKALQAARPQARRKALSPSRSYPERLRNGSARMRIFIGKANRARARLAALRQVLAGLLTDTRFVGALTLDGIESVPDVAFGPNVGLRRTRAEMLCTQLRRRAKALVSGDGLTRNARTLLEKLKGEPAVEAAEIMILANDPTQYHAQALVAAASPTVGNEASGRGKCAAAMRKLKPIIHESRHVHGEAKRALTEYGHEALELIVVEAFVRRLLSSPCVVNWLEQHKIEALLHLRRV